jgi:hypothetical protein
MTTAFNWRPESVLLEQLINLAHQQGRSPEEIVTQAVISYLQTQASSSDRPPTPPLSLHQRREFLKLPRQERRRILQAQAEALSTHYQNDSEWQELQTGDLIEY